MNVIKIKTAKEIANALKKTYCYGGQWSSTALNTSEEVEAIYRNLINIKKVIKDSELKDILGNFKAWRYNHCNSCFENKLEEMVHILTNDEGGEEIICKSCLKKGLNLLEKKELS